jgi:hypothetical protein
MVQKALNPIRPVLIRPLASKSSISRAFLDASDASGGTTFVRLLSRRAVFRSVALLTERWRVGNAELWGIARRRTL